MKLLCLPLLCLSLTGLAAPLQVTETADAIRLSDDGREVLVYHKAEVPPPAGADPRFRRSGFIHPLRTPAGAAVTGVHPPDHFHHFGLWHAWVKGRHAGQPVDFWNLKDGTGRVRFGAVKALHQTADAAGFEVEQEAVRCRDGEPVVTVLRETLTVRLRRLAGAYEIDYDLRQTNVSAETLELPAYRYGGGLACRAPLDWGRDNSDYLTSAGKTRRDSHGTRARWVAVHGPGTAGRATLAVLGHPGNRDAPQCLRTWDDGKVFLNFVPVQQRDWAIGPGATVRQRYRLVCADGAPDAGDLDARWQRYAAE